jgi:hypothetical protein
LKDPPKFTQIGIFWVENMPSGNLVQKLSYPTNKKVENVRLLVTSSVTR